MTIDIDPSIFRAYDIRGIVDKNLTENAMEMIGQAIGSIVLELGKIEVVVARDGRISSERLSEALCIGIIASGCNVIDIGAAPTPVLYFATHELDTNSGVMITGSHNPPNYNGLKIVLNGETLGGGAIQQLYRRVVNEDFEVGMGQIREVNLIDTYIDRVCHDIQLAKPFKVAIDCGSGIGGVVAPKLFRQLGCEVVDMFCEVDGHFPHHHPDPSQPENLQYLINTVKREQADVGFAFDGDGDRLGVVTNTGKIIWPDRLLMLFAIDILLNNPGATIIYDVKSSRHLYDLIKQYGGQPLMSKTGHSFVKAAMRESGALIAGEMSGHIFFKDGWYGFDDALYASVRFLDILSRRGISSESLFGDLPDSVSTPELKLAVDDNEKFNLMEKIEKNVKFDGAKLTTIDGLRADFNNGWGLVRPSNTTPSLVFRFEADDEEGLKKIQGLFRRELLNIDSNLQLPF